ncbi:MAG: hypothetical protein ABIL58_22330 [Pseudomonadota bacterium]
MTADEYKTVVGFESGLKPGDPVLERWKVSGWRFAAAATVSKINEKSIVVEINQAIPDPGASGFEYSAGHKIRVDNFSGKGWGYRSRVEPVGGY